MKRLVHVDSKVLLALSATYCFARDDGRAIGVAGVAEDGLLSRLDLFVSLARHGCTGWWR